MTITTVKRTTSGQLKLTVQPRIVVIPIVLRHQQINQTIPALIKSERAKPIQTPRTIVTIYSPPYLITMMIIKFVIKTIKGTISLTFYIYYNKIFYFFQMWQMRCLATIPFNAMPDLQ
jgi:hypothetical protein